MLKKCITAAFSILLAALLVCGCGNKPVGSDTSPTKGEVAYNTSFSGIPKMDYENVEVFVSGDTVIFEYINPGMDSFTAEIISYSLSQDKVLGRLNLGEGSFKLSVIQDGFAVVDLMKHTADYYDKSCSKTSSVKVFENESLSFAEVSYDGKYVLAQSLTSDLLIYNGKTQKTSRLNKDKIFEKAKYSNGKFYLLGVGAAVLEPENNHYYGISDAVGTYGVGGDYIVGVNGSYIALLSAGSANHKMTDISERQGYLIDVSDFGCALVDYAENESLAWFYDINFSGFVQHSEKSNIICAKQISENYAIIVTKNSENALDYKLLDLKGLQKNSIKTEKLNMDLINGVAQLPDYGGNNETVRLTKQIEKDYGVRVLFCEDIFDTNNSGFDISGTDENTAYSYMLKLGDYFDYYPKGLLKDAGLGRPLVLYLCDKIKDNIEGLSTYNMGYNIIYLQVGGKDEHFFSSLTHEIGHALENGIDTNLIEGWVKLMPDEVIKAYGDGIEGISVEYTPDDKGRTPVWFRDVYGRSNEKEDRATVFQEMYDCYTENKVGMFKYDGLKKKADYWSYMLRETYASCKNIDKFSWEK